MTNWRLVYDGTEENGEPMLDILLQPQEEAAAPDVSIDVNGLTYHEIRKSRS